MNQIFQVNKQGIHIDTLTIEGLDCKKNCQGCYFQAHTLKGPISKWDIEEVFDLFLYSEEIKYSANQINISVNEPINSMNKMFIENLLMSVCSFRKNEIAKSTHINLTMFSPSTMQQYTSICPDMWAAVDSIYFSNIREDEVDLIKELRRENENLEIGWNCSPMSQSKLCTANDKIVDQVYHVKNKTGTNNKICLIDHTKDICQVDYNYWRQNSSHSCSANISKFTIWPDGSVSGCPYVKTSNTGPADTVEGILDNIVEASEHYDFNRCPMKEIYG